MLSEYEGPSSNPRMFPHLVGEKIAGVFVFDEQLFLVVESGHALKVASNRVDGGDPFYTVLEPTLVIELVTQKYQSLFPQVAAFSALPLKVGTAAIKGVGE